jgi:hypothetical protein
MPLAFDGTLLVEVVTLLEMSLGVSLPAGHCANREHSPTLALFEVQDQQFNYERKHSCGRPTKKGEGLIAQMQRVRRVRCRGDRGLHE